MATATARWPCIHDATTLAGLAALRRAHPDRWHTKMRKTAKSVGSSATVSEAMRAGGMGRLLPRGPGEPEARRLKKLRHSARMLCLYFGGTLLDCVNEAWMRRQLQPLVDRLGRDRAGACLTLLRQVVSAATLRKGGSPTLAPRAPRRRASIGPPPERPVAEWDTVELLTRKATPRVRAAVCLQAHLGLTPGRVLELRVDDLHLDPHEGTLRARVLGRDGRVVEQRFSLPPDACRAVSPWARAQRRKGHNAPLFPQRGAPKRSTASINRAIAREAARLIVEAPTMASIRRLAQVALRDLGASRAQVRGSARGPEVQRALSRAASLARQRSRWAFQQGAAPQHLPLRAPARCPVNEPERGRRRVMRRMGVGHSDTPLSRRPPEPAQPRPTLPALPPLEPHDNEFYGEFYHLTSTRPGPRLGTGSLPRTMNATPPPARPSSPSRPMQFSQTSGDLGLTVAGVVATFAGGIVVGCALKDEIEGGVQRVVDRVQDLVEPIE